MVKLFQGTKNEYYMDAYLVPNLEIAKKMVKKDFDFLMAIDGYEGSGKSVLAQQIGFYLDPTLTLDRICFTPKDFKQKVIDAEPETCVILDEAYGALSARKTLSMTNTTIVDLLTEIRQKRLFIIIVLPSIFDLDRYVAIWRSRCLIHVYVKGLERGRYAFYNSDKKKTLILLGKKTYNYHVVEPNFRGAFANQYTVDEEEYRQKKLDSLRALKEENSPKATGKTWHISLFNMLRDQGWPVKEIHRKWEKFDENCPNERTLFRWSNNDTDS